MQVARAISEIHPPTPRRRTVYTWRRATAMAILLIAFLGCLGLARVATSAALASSHLAVEELGRSQVNARRERDRLYLQVQQASSLVRLEQEAMTQLGMVRPGEVGIIFMKPGEVVALERPQRQTRERPTSTWVPALTGQLYTLVIQSLARSWVGE